MNLLAGVLSHLEHARSLRPSALYTTYLLISVALDAAIVRTIWLRRGDDNGGSVSSVNMSICIVTTVSFVFKVAVLVLEAREKRSLLISNGARKDQHQEREQKHGPEETSGIFSQGFFWWLNELLLRGYRQLLRPDDLYPVQEDMSAAALNEKFWTTWNKGV